MEIRLEAVRLKDGQGNIKSNGGKKTTKSYNSCMYLTVYSFKNVFLTLVVVIIIVVSVFVSLSNQLVKEDGRPPGVGIGDNFCCELTLCKATPG